MPKKKTNFPARGHSRKQSFELAAWAARLWVDPRWSLELSADQKSK